MGKKNKGGRPKYEIDYQALDASCIVFCTGEECANILKVNYKTLNNALIRDGHTSFRDYYKKASVKGKKSLRAKQYEIANGGNVAMLIWLGKQILGQAEPISPQQERQQEQAIADKQLAQFERLIKLRESGLFSEAQLREMANLINE